MPDSTATLATLDYSGAVPTTRMADAMDIRNRVDTLIQADNRQRAHKRLLVKALTDGNPPFSHKDLVDAGMSDRCNVNWGISRAYLAAGWRTFYDIFSETATYAQVTTEFGKGTDQLAWNEIMTEEFDVLLKSNPSHDYEMQCSQFDMVLYGGGPLVFRSPLDWRYRYNQYSHMLVPEMARSKTDEWEEAAFRVYSTPHDLYSSIRYEKAATDAGWNIEQTKNSIIWAHPKANEGGQYNNWEVAQQRLKNGAYQYSAECKVIHLAHYFFREFPKENEEMGRISHVIVDMSFAGQGPHKHLYRREGRFKDWNQIVHPMYYDHGAGGYHHSVEGMGIKMFGAHTYQNRLLCNLADKVFAPKVMFKPTSANAQEEFQMARFGDYAELPFGYDSVQMPTQGFLDEGMAFNEKISQILASNLSQYRQELQKTDGNPITATQVNRMASEDATLSKTQLNHYYNQLDWLYAEQFRRAANFNLPASAPGAEAAKKFQNRCCKVRGVPQQAMKMAMVKASRIVGQGSAFLRKQTLIESMQLVLPRLPESGQSNMVRDFVASQFGYSLVNRYAPERDKGAMPTDQEAFATLQVVSCKDGVAPVITDTQNPVIFAGIFLKAAMEALQGVQQAGPSAIPTALAFCDAIGPAIAKHLSRIQNDPTRVAVFKALSAQFKQFTAGVDQLHQVAQQMQQKQQQQSQQMQRAKVMQNGQDPELQLKTMVARHDMMLKEQKTQADLQHKAEKTDQNLAAKAATVKQNLAVTDLKTAQTFRHERAKTIGEMQRKNVVTAQTVRHKEALARASKTKSVSK